MATAFVTARDLVVSEKTVNKLINNFFDINFVIKTDDKKARRFDLSEVIFKWSKKTKTRKITRRLKYAFIVSLLRILEYFNCLVIFLICMFFLLQLKMTSERSKRRAFFIVRFYNKNSQTVKLHKFRCCYPPLTSCFWCYLMFVISGKQ